MISIAWKCGVLILMICIGSSMRLSWRRDRRDAGGFGDQTRGNGVGLGAPAGDQHLNTHTQPLEANVPEFALGCSGHSIRKKFMQTHELISLR